jgi:Kef-type K+ transport system membrane component KefB
MGDLPGARYTIGGALAVTGIVLSLLYTGSAMATTAIGTLIPILSDSGELRTRFGTYLLAAGAVGEFGPILLLTLFLSAHGTLHNALILTAFVVVAVGVALLAVRWIVVLVFALALLAFELGLDLLLGGFAAGVITRQLLKGRDVPGFDSKLTAVAFGVFIPFFFVVSGMELDITALFSGAGGVVKLFVFFALFLVVRGIPALLLYRDVMEQRERLALAFFQSTQLPLVLAITTLARENGKMSASTAAALVCAAVLSTLFFPLIGLRLRSDRPKRMRRGEVVASNVVP